MVANIANAVAAYRNAAGNNAGGASGGMMTQASGGGSFMDQLKDVASEALETGKVNEQITGKATMGKADLSEVVMAANNAEVTLQTVVAVRDKVVQAYQDILRMPI